MDSTLRGQFGPAPHVTVRVACRACGEVSELPARSTPPGTQTRCGCGAYVQIGNQEDWRLQTAVASIHSTLQRMARV